MSYITNILSTPVLSIDGMEITLKFFVEVILFMFGSICISDLIKDYLDLGGNAAYEWSTIPASNDDTEVLYMDNSDQLISTKIDYDFSIHPTICKQCGMSFKLDEDGSGKCPACGTYYSRFEVK